MDNLTPQTIEHLWKFRDKWMWYIAAKDRMRFLDDVYDLVYDNSLTGAKYEGLTGKYTKVDLSKANPTVEDERKGGCEK